MRYTKWAVLLLAALLVGCRGERIATLEPSDPTPQAQEQLIQGEKAALLDDIIKQPESLNHAENVMRDEDEDEEEQANSALVSDAVKDEGAAKEDQRPEQITAYMPLLPTPSGVLVQEGERTMIDYSNTAEGYVMVHTMDDSGVRMKVQVVGPATTYTYNLAPFTWQAFPLTEGNGTYKITVYKNVTGSKYAALMSLSHEVVLRDEFVPFLYANQFVDYAVAPKSIKKAEELTAGCQSGLEKVKAVYDYVVNNMTYDREKAANVESGYLPVLDEVLEAQTGICFDYAALMTGMLRSQGIPSKLVVGYAGNVYHAWISVWTPESGWLDSVIYFDGSVWKRMDPTFASTGNQSESTLAYIGNEDNYISKYFY